MVNRPKNMKQTDLRFYLLLDADQLGFGVGIDFGSVMAHQLYNQYHQIGKLIQIIDRIAFLMRSLFVPHKPILVWACQCLH